MRVRFWCESTRDTKNACDTVVAHFLLFPPNELPRAFPTKARSHCPITALALVFWSVKGTGYRGSGISNDRLHSRQSGISSVGPQSHKADAECHANRFASCASHLTYASSSARSAKTFSQKLAIPRQRPAQRFLPRSPPLNLLRCPGQFGRRAGG